MLPQQFVTGFAKGVGVGIASVAGVASLGSLTLALSKVSNTTCPVFPFLPSNCLCHLLTTVEASNLGTDHCLLWSYSGKDKQSAIEAGRVGSRCNGTRGSVLACASGGRHIKGERGGAETGGEQTEEEEESK